ncbi:hypothetical protein KFE25_009760 [Diacronema lutheri]|uniref:Uncharacterized protein n=1 Tax=Diacronema lutheri TaxID=2081491 RepID=A0A8J5XBX1_DIALT|nr:hypothetical protein KFE25_009760 [Diacronema lutheri]
MSARPTQPPSASSNQVDLGWRQRVDKELTRHLLPPDAPPALAQPQPLAGAPGPWVSSGPIAAHALGLPPLPARHRSTPAAPSVRAPPPWAISEPAPSSDAPAGGDSFRGADVRRSPLGGRSLSHGALRAASGEAAGVPSARRASWRAHQPPSIAGSAASSRCSGSCASHCTALPFARGGGVSEALSARTGATEMGSRLEMLERLFHEEREARQKLEAQLARVEAARGAQPARASCRAVARAPTAACGGAAQPQPQARLGASTRR